MALALIAALAITISGAAANVSICETSILEKFFLIQPLKPPGEQILKIQSACKLVSNPPQLVVVQQAKSNVDKNLTVVESRDLIVYAKALYEEIRKIDNQTDFGIYLIDYPDQECIVPKGVKIPAGITPAMVIKDNINGIDVFKADNINPPWTKAKKGIEANGAVNASNTDEIIESLFVGKVNSITPIT